jgi:3-methylfumaryl-CoA hydratase
MDDFSAWLERTETRADRLDPTRSNVLRAAIGRAGDLNDGDPLPCLHHWLHFWDARTPAETGPDGHPRRGGFLPPVPLPRRMWAGGRLIFRTPLHFGEEVRRVSTIKRIEAKSGRTGQLVFVTVAHVLHGRDGPAIEEEQDIVYRGEGVGAAPVREPDMAPPDEALPTDPVLLFRYSALTMNGHRIHYDLAYATGIEGYSGLVVQGPLQATLLAELAERRLGKRLETFRFRGLAPAIAGPPLGLHAEATDEGLDLWTSQDNARRMSARASAGN